MSSQDSVAADIPSNSRVIDLSGGPIAIGRASAKDGDRSAKTSNLYIRNPHLSKSHARVWVEDAAVFLKDNGSTFGTVWNNNLLVPEKAVAIYEGDTVGFVINRPSYVIKTLIGKALSTPMVLLDKLLNPRVQLQFVVHSIDLDSETLVLLPVNDTTADASVELVLAETNEVENTPDVTVHFGLAEDEDAVESNSNDSDNDAPVEERIVKEVSFAETGKSLVVVPLELLDNGVERECILIAETSIDLNEDDDDEEEDELFSEEDEDDDEDEDEDGDDDDEEDDEEDEETEVESVESEDEVEEVLYREYQQDKEEDCCRLLLKEKIAEEQDHDDLMDQSPEALLVRPWPSSDDDVDYNYESQIEDEDTMLDAIIEGEGIRYDDGEECVYVKKIVECRIDDCRVPGVKYVFDEDYNSDEDETFQAPGDEYSEESDSELDTPSTASDGECIFNSARYSDDETISDDDVPYDWCCQSLKSPYYQAPVYEGLGCKAISGSKRSYEEADLEDDGDEVVPTEPKRSKKSSAFRTVLKEVGKGVLYVTGTLIALAAYGSRLENQ